MSTSVSISVNNRTFVVGCEPGQEDHVRALGKLFDDHVGELSAQVGQIGDLRLFLMAALVIADTLNEAHTERDALKARIAELEAHSTDDASAASASQKEATALLNKAAQSIEKLVEKLESRS